MPNILPHNLPQLSNIKHINVERIQLERQNSSLSIHLATHKFQSAELVETAEGGPGWAGYTGFEVAYSVALIYATLGYAMLGYANGEVAAGVVVDAVAELAAEAEEGTLVVVARLADMIS
jgi:hypothetical protein